MNVPPICLPFTATVTLVLYSDPKEFLAAHLKTKTPSFSKCLLHIPEVLVFKIALSFSNSQYNVTPGLALAEQLKLMTSPAHALLSTTELVNWTFSGLSRIEERDN